MIDPARFTASIPDPMQPEAAIAIREKIAEIDPWIDHCLDARDRAAGVGRWR